MEIYEYIKKSYDGKNSKLPTEEQFAVQLGVSRITVRTALNELASEGIIFRRQGRGTFVNAEAVAIKVSFNPVTLFTEMICQCGYQPSVELLGFETIRADLAMSRALMVEEDAQIIRVNKVFFADGHPCTYIEDYFPVTLMNNLKSLESLEDYAEDLFEFVEAKCHRKITWDKVEIRTCTNKDDDRLSTFFRCRDKIKSFLLLEGVNYDDNDAPVIYAKEYIDTDYIHFNSIRQKIY